MSTKKMHPPAVNNSTIQTGGKSSVLVNTATKTVKDRQNSENVVPSSNGNAASGEVRSNSCNGKKAVHKATSVNVSKVHVGSTATVVSTLNSANRRKNHRINSPNRRRQEKQSIFNSLKEWNDKYVQSGSAPSTAAVSHTKQEQATSTEISLASCEIKPKPVASASSVEGGKVKSESSTVGNVNNTTGSGGQSSISSNTSSSTIVSSNSINNCNSNTMVKNKKQPAAGAVGMGVVPKESEAGVPVMVQTSKRKQPTESGLKGNNSSVDTKGKSCSQAATVGGTETFSTSAKEEKKLLNTNGGISANHRQSAAPISPSLPPSTENILSSSSTNVSYSSSGSQPIHTSSTALITTSPSLVTNASTMTMNGSKHSNSSNIRTANAGKVLIPNGNHLTGPSLDPVLLLQNKLRNTLKLDSFVTVPQTHHISHHHSAHSHHPGQGQGHHGQQQHQIPPTTPPHYSIEYLHFLGMQMSNANGTSQTGNTAAATTSALFRGNAQFNFNNYNQQLHPQQMVQQQQHHHQLSHPHMQRPFPNYYKCDDLLIQPSGVGEPLYTNFGIAEHLVNGNVAGAGGAQHSGTNDAGMVYCYSQNHQHHHHHNHPTHQHSYASNGHHNHHQNNNYQQHNRNYGRSTQHNGNTNPQNGGKKSWNNWNNNKRSNMLQGKYGNKGPGFNHGYRKNYHYYNSHHSNGGHHYDQQQDHMRNLVYVRGFDRNQDQNPSSQDSASRSPTPSPQSESPAIDTNAPNQSLATAATVQDEKSDSGIEEGIGNLKKAITAQGSSSSSSSSMVSIPSTDSSVGSSSVSQNLSLELQGSTTQGYESDSSHSSSYNSHTYRSRKYTNGGQVYRSSSSTSSGVSSNATFPPISSDFLLQSSGSAIDSSIVTSSQVADFFLRSQSYHGSHQNLAVHSGSASPNPPDSPVGGVPRSLVGTQSMPMFSELFTGSHQLQPQAQNHNQHILTLQHQRSNGSSILYGSNSSLELSIPAGNESSLSINSNSSNSITSNGSSSGVNKASSSMVPPNEPASMQSGHPKRRISGRISPIPHPNTNKSTQTSIGNNNSCTSATSSQQQKSQPQSPTSQKGTSIWNHNRPLLVPSVAATSTAGTQPATSETTAAHPPPALPPLSPAHLLFPVEGGNYHTPADRFLSKSHLVELVTPPVDLAPEGSKWAALSTAIWDKFAAVQQTQHKFVQKIQLWKYLFMCIRKAFPRFSLYLVGSTISGFAADNSDVDMCLVCRTNSVPFDMRMEALFQLGQLKNYFMNINTCFEEFSVIQAKVPILRFRDSTNSIVVDLNYNNCVGIRNTHLLYCYSQMDWRLRPLTLVVKLWAQHHNINDAKNMTISSYSLVLMVIHFLQYGVTPPILPCLHAMYPDKFVRMSDISNLDLTETVEPYKNDNTQTLGELFVQFLEYYANFDYTHYAISVRTASIIPIESARVARSYKNDPHHWRQLCIEEPFDLTNTARSVFDADIFEQIKSVFSTCWQRLKETNDLNSVFECEPLFIPVASALSITS